jgi:hypothetical protein
MGVECDDMLERHPPGLEFALQEMHQQLPSPDLHHRARLFST